MSPEPRWGRGHRSRNFRFVPSGFPAFGHRGKESKKCDPWIVMYKLEIGHRLAFWKKCSPCSPARKEYISARGCRYAQKG